jgi:hypothetical protein
VTEICIWIAGFRVTGHNESRFLVFHILRVGFHPETLLVLINANIFSSTQHKTSQKSQFLMLCLRRICLIYSFVSLLFCTKTTGSYLNGTNIVVGVVSSGEFSDAGVIDIWGPTFEEMLSESVGQFLSPARNFTIVLMTIPQTFQMVEDKSIDFFFSTPSIFSCLESEYAGDSFL